ncbi:TIGR03915 family putative DNA repair protein [Acinetobacter johnsonii]|uniref:TIGR03915 family putative DNA repair protein n=1 Tax=Acinetobacter johnsonii TaxID=40214 RepID=UPI0011E705DE|nr:TIGR03915 family putative DNA repair protein [Acinetobacter johnsonii]QEK36010.1 DNA metabolism protein [Acinetobacter johnsonii]
MSIYRFDQSMTGLLSCVYRSFQFKDFDVKLASNNSQASLFDECIEVASNDEHAERVWRGLKQKITAESLRSFYYCFLSEQEEAHQHLFNFCIYVFKNTHSVDRNYAHADILAVSQWAKQVGREKHRMEAFVRFKKCQDGLFLSLVQPDFNVLPLIERHFRNRYQDQRWLIYDERRNFGIYYDLTAVHQVKMDVDQIDHAHKVGQSQSFSVELDDDELLYDQLWKDYFKSINIEARANIKLHVQYVPKRYWRYMNEKTI